MTQNSTDNADATIDFEATAPQSEDESARSAELSRAAQRPPSEVPGYRILRPIGEGKYGSVWLAYEQNTGKQVAIKFYTHRRGVDWSLLSREVEKLAVLYTSRNIVGLLAVGWEHDPPYYVMEYLEHGSLAQRLLEGPLTPAEAVTLTTRISLALVHAHGCGILHCDLKPANILLDQNLEPRLCDFGQSRLVDEQVHALGTLFYMAPEQADLKGVPDARWDVYALGAILYHMLCGAPPLRTPENEDQLRGARTLEERLALYREIVETSPRPTQHRRMAGVDRELADIVDRCLAVHPTRRFPNAQAVLDRLLQREHHRSRRPLKLLAMLLPPLLVLSLAPLAWSAVRDAIVTTRMSVTRRALESDALSANLLAQSLEWELRLRLEELSSVAEEPDVQAHVMMMANRPRDQRGPLIRLLDEYGHAYKQKLVEMHRTADSSWFLCDERGTQRWRVPDTDTVDRNFAWRDYFHGQNQDFSPDQPTESLRPIESPHISTVYLSTSTGQYTFALSVPVWSPDHSQVVGVLARSVFLSDLLDIYEEGLRDSNADGVSRHLAVVDSRDWKILAHPWMTRENLQSLTGDQYRELHLDQDAIEHVQAMLAEFAAGAGGGVASQLDHFVDPLGEVSPEYRGHYLAAFCPIRETTWVAIVQEPRQDVWRPVEQLRSRMIWAGIGGVVLLVSLVAGTSWMLVWVAGGEGRRSRSPWQRNGGSPLASSASLTQTAKGTDSV